MKLLFDHNLSSTLIGRLADIFPQSDHVFHLGMDQSDDIEICNFAAQNVFIIVTKDADYSELLNLRVVSPAIVWIRKGNCSTAHVEEILRANAAQILSLDANDKVRLLMLF